MGLRFKFWQKNQPHVPDDTPGRAGWGAPLQIIFAKRALPPVDNAAQYAYQTYLSPIYTPIGGGIPNKRDIGTSKPSYARQGVLVQPVTGNGILAGSFVSGPLTNVDATQSNIPAATGFSNFQIPAN